MPRFPESGRSAPRPRLDASEKRRRSIVRLTLLLFIMLVFEGSTRKWIAPQLAQYLYFMRDPVALVLYVLAVRNHAFRPLHPMLLAGMAFALIAIPIAVVQCLGNSSPNQALFEIYGWRNYFWYMPLPFILATQFRQEDLDALGKLAVLLLLIAAPLAVVQFWSSPDSAWNAGVGEDEALKFTSLRSANGHIRPAGPFTSILGMVEMTASTAALVFNAWILPRAERPMSSLWLVAGAGAVAMSLAVSGSRTMFVSVGLVLLAGICSGVVMRQSARMMRATTMPIVLAVIFLVLFPVLFPEGYSTITNRWDEAYQSESQVGVHGVFGRFMAELLDFLRVVGDVPLLGYGIGLGGNAALTLKATGTSGSAIPYVESDWSRHMVDLGSFLGLAFILYRIAFTWWLGAAAVKATRSSQRPLPLLVFGYAGIVLLQAQISGNGVVNGFCWLYVGVCMAACAQPATKAASREATELARPGPLLRRHGNLMP